MAKCRLFSFTIFLLRSQLQLVSQLQWVSTLPQQKEKHLLVALCSETSWSFHSKCHLQCQKLSLALRFQKCSSLMSECQQTFHMDDLEAAQEPCTLVFRNLYAPNLLSSQNVLTGQNLPTVKFMYRGTGFPNETPLVKLSPHLKIN